MIVGTRGSRLAVAQTDMFVDRLKALHPEIETELRIVATTGDKVRDQPLASLGGFGAFVKELDNKIVAGEIDCSVNSLKDMPVVCTPGTRIVAVMTRGPVEDVLISDVPLKELPEGAVVGTSSVRRKALLLHMRPDLKVADLRGNVPTRVNKMRTGQFDAILLARAGLDRLGIACCHSILDPTQFVPAVGQGAIAISCAERSIYAEVLSDLNHTETRLCVEMERYILAGLGGGCSVPIGIWAVRELNEVRVRGVVLREDGSKAFRLDRSIGEKRPREELDDYIHDMKEGWEGLL
jgi:hydroxymethylbilane synthase